MEHKPRKQDSSLVHSPALLCHYEGTFISTVTGGQPRRLLEAFREVFGGCGLEVNKKKNCQYSLRAVSKSLEGDRPHSLIS